MQKSYHLYITEVKSGKAVYGVTMIVKNGKPRIEKASKLGCYAKADGSKWRRANIKEVSKALGIAY